uniref:ATP-dependent DNA helicase n=1 Tax=Nicotiana tabacum TaxID=4097 RepID=A0A1S4D186_TOBAC|nr:PREDICTED: uncharacterized protein LOC107824908 [Nicotiana tabacum]
MTVDYKVLQITKRSEIRYQALNHINDILHSMGHDINEYELMPETIRPSVTAKEAKEIHFERSIIVSEDDVLLHRKLNKNQLIAYNVITERIFSNKAGAFFVDGPGGTRKTFLYRALLATIRSMGYIALATTTSGVAASIFPGGRTAHSYFKIPIDIDENASCNISKESSLAGLIRDAKLIVWDEVSMAKKKMLEVFDLLLKDLMDTNALFGEKVVVFGGYFRQTLPVVRYGKKEDFISESLLYSNIWNQLEKLKLSENMRAKMDPAFCDYLLKIGNRQEQVNSANKIEISDSLIFSYTIEKESLDKLFTATYSNLDLLYSNSFCTDSRVILTTTNDFVDEINDMLIDRLTGKSKTYIGTDEAIEFNNQTQFEDLLHTLNPPISPSAREKSTYYYGFWILKSRKGFPPSMMSIYPHINRLSEEQWSSDAIYSEKGKSLLSPMQGLFEALKTYRKYDDNILLFRPKENAMRLKMGAERMYAFTIPPPGNGSVILVISLFTLLLDGFSNGYVAPLALH